MECLEWAYAFKEAPDLEVAGAAIARSLVKAVVGGPPDPDQLPGRLILEDYATDFIRRSRERDFAWVAKLPTFADLLKTFTAQNAALENYTRREPQVAVAPPEMPADLRSIVVPGIEPQLGSSTSRVEQLLESVLERLDDQAHRQVSVLPESDSDVGARPSRTEQVIEPVRISTAVTRYLSSEAKRTKTRMGRAGADVGEAERLEDLADRVLVIGNAEVLADEPLQVDPPPAHDAVDRPIRTDLDKPGGFGLLVGGQAGRVVLRPVVPHPVGAVLVEAVHPVAQGLPIHAAVARRRGPVHPVQHRCQGQQAAALIGVLRGSRQPPKVRRRKVRSHAHRWCHGAHPPSTKQSDKPHQRKLRQSEPMAFGISVGTLLIPQPGWLTGILTVDRALRFLGVEAQHPIENRLQAVPNP